MKKILVAILAGAMVVSMVACAGGGTATESKAAPTTESKAESTAAPAAESKAETAGGEGDIHVASWNNAADNLSEIATAFNAQEGHSGKVIIDYADGDYTKLRPALAAGTGVPDIFQTQNRDITAFYNNYGLQAFTDISDIIEPDAANWVSFALETCKAEDGKYYAIPWDIGPIAMFYRTDIFEQAGIDPKTLTTWDKYIEAGKKLKQSGDYYVEAYNYNGATTRDSLMIYLNQQGGQFYNAEGKVNLASPEMLKAVDLSKKMIAEGVAMDIPNAWDDRITAINNNKLVALCYAAWFMGTMKNSCADLSGKWGIAPMPAFEEGGNNTANAGGSVLAVSSGTKNLQLAKDFLVYGMKSDEGNDVNTKFGEFPSYKPAYNTAFFKSTDPYFSNLPVGEIFSSLTGAPATTWGPYYLDIHESTKNMAGNIFTQGMEPQKALEDATKEAQSKIDIK